MNLFEDMMIVTSLERVLWFRPISHAVSLGSQMANKQIFFYETQGEKKNMVLFEHHKV